LFALRRSPLRRVT